MSFAIKIVYIIYNFVYGGAMYDYSKIQKYVLWLKKNEHLSVSIHSAGNQKIVTNPEISAFNVHDNPYCAYIKGSKCAAADCVRKQASAEKKCRSGAYFGMCRTGVAEFVYPVRASGETVGFISVSGYRLPEGEKLVRQTALHYGLDEKTALSKYALLKEAPKDSGGIDTLIMPLSDMLTLALITGGEKRTTVAGRIVAYINGNYSLPITSEDICKALSVSRAYMSREFNREINMPLRDYINTVRIKNAKVLLQSSELSVSEVAYSVGFSDSGYFSSVFKKNVGLSPREYKKQRFAY